MLKNRRYERIGIFLWLLAICGLLQVAPPLIAQTTTGLIKGTVRDESGKTVASASVTATRSDTGQNQTANTGPDGTYKLELPAGNYRLTIQAAGFKTLEISSVTVIGTVPEVLDSKLEKGETVNGQPTPTQQENLPNAPSSSTTAPSLSDLGLSPEQTQGNSLEQALLDKGQMCVARRSANNRLAELAIFLDRIHAINKRYS